MREHPLPEAEIAARIEAALYSAGRPLSLDELIKASGTNSKEKTHRIINDIARKVKSTFRAIEIAQLEDGKYVFQLRPEYTPLVRKFAQHPLLPPGALKTLSYIAYEQPVTSKRLVQIRGSQVYPHIKVLEQMQFVEHENLGRLKVYRTTPKFQNYFGITDLNAVKSKLVTTTTSTATATAKKTSKQRPTTKDTPLQSTAEAAAGEAGTAAIS
ncbi:MAG TPA: SMC-Scp complex subunit ScpB [Nitrososphaera sp.]|nr:SMC-Scp complex subunit ScpB [Nitrososphaera sp.]